MNETWSSDNWLTEAEEREKLVVSPAVARLAVLGTFEPERIEGPEELSTALRLVALQIQRDDERKEWMLTESCRIQALSNVLREGGLDGLSNLRDEQDAHFNSPLQRMLDAFVLHRYVPLEERSEEELVASTHVWRWATRAIARAGLTDKVAVVPRLEEIQGRLSLAEVARPVRKLVANGVIGREVELRRLHEYLHVEPNGRGLTDDPAFCVHGIGGVGKSTLVARFVLDLFEAGESVARQPWAYLDFDRPTLKAVNPSVVLDDVSLQVGAQFPELQKFLEYRRTSFEAGAQLSGLESVDTVGSFREAAVSLGGAVSDLTKGGVLVVVLDTFEEVQRNPRATRTIFELFDSLAAVLPGLRLVVSGRAPVPEFEDPRRRDRVMEVRGLEDHHAVELLQAILARESPQTAPLDPALARDVVGLVGNSPLSLLLAARVLAKEGTDAIATAADRARALGQVRDEYIRGFLYRRILDHLEGPSTETRSVFRDLARASLAVRLITKRVIGEVLFPSVGLGNVDFDVDEVYRAMEKEVALVEKVDDGLALREDLRRHALAALRYENDELVQRVHRTAVQFYASNPNEPRAKVESIYHRLASHEAPFDLAPQLDEEVLRKLGPSLADLPASTATVLRTLVEAGQDEAKEKSLSHEEQQLRWEQSVLSQADAALRSGDPERAQELLSERQERSATTELYRLESRLREQTGDFEEAILAAEADREAAERAENPKRLAAAAIREAKLLERIGRAQLSLELLERIGRSALLAGNPSYRLELHLNRMTTAERAGLWSEDDRWIPGLEARKHVQDLGARAVRESSALCRLLAAALGAEEPQWIRDALSRIGLGEEAEANRIDALVEAVMEWGNASREASRAVWRDRLSILGMDAGEALLKLWETSPPPERALEAIRMFYLWWGVDPYVGIELAASRSTPEFGEIEDMRAEPHFLETLDFRRKETREFERLLEGAYPDSGHLESLASRAGIPLQELPKDKSHRARVRDILDIAKRSSKVDQLLLAFLEDPSAASFRPKLVEILGDEWIARHKKRGFDGFL